jgi:putative ABC transport system substrate-binding protein
MLAAPLASEAQPAGRIPRLCFLTFDPGTPQSSRFDPFFQGLRDLGYVDGQTITIDYLSADGRGERFLALARRLPTFATLRELPEAGGLFSYGPSIGAIYRRGAYYVDKILKGAKPGDLPVEQPTKFELVVNLKTAKALGLTIPPSLLRQADEVIQ